MTKPMKRPIVILFTGHVGSSWLTSLLGSHESITQLGFEPVDDFVLKNIDSAAIFEKVFRGQAISKFPAPVRRILTKNYEKPLEDQLFQGTKKPDCVDTPFVLFKTRLYPEKQSRLFFDILPNSSPIIIFLNRRNKIKNAISQFKRTQLNISHLGNFHETENKRKPVRVDPAYILDRATNFVRRELLAKIYFERLKQMMTSVSYEIFYEDLLSTSWRSGFLDNFFNELGLKSDICDSNYLKMTPDSIKEAVINVDELSRHLNGTDFKPSLRSDEYDIVNEIYTKKLEFPVIKIEPMIKKIHSMFETIDHA